MRKTSIQQKNRRLIRALIIIVIFNVGGFYIVRIFKYFILSYKLSEMNSLFIRKAVCTLLYVSITANAPVLYFIR
uniref:Uncharacterized protein n=2 Tax=Meloidogyne TaxID=189290 RepID=A0A6V7WFP5_MELEN|nr:unnamed protein product [Meloidogyne enterolobii]